MQGTRNKNLSLLSFTAPALIFYTAFMLIPMLGGILYSLTNWNGLNQSYTIVGIKNYLNIFQEDKDFLQAILFTFKYVIVMVVLQNVLALSFAIMIESRGRDKTFFRTVFFAPNMISLIVGTLMCSFVFSKVMPEMARITGIAFFDKSWLGDPAVSFWTIIAVSLWQGVGYMMVIYMAALQGVPKELKEAALIDGVNPVQSFIYVVLPLIQHSITICTFLTLNSSVKVFDVVLGLTKGGPGRATEVLTLNIYNEAYAFNMKYGYASAKAIVLFLLVLVITVLQLTAMKRKEVEM